MSKENEAQLKSLQTRLGNVLKEVDDLNAKAAKGETVDLKKIDQLLGEGDALKLQIVGLKHTDELKAWAHGSDGGATVPNYLGEDENPDEKSAWRNAGPLEGLAIDGAAIKSTKDGYAGLDKAGELKAQRLNSGEYKDAFNWYLRNCWKPNWGQISATKGNYMKVLQEGQDSAGGLWVVPDIRSEMVKKEATMATIRPNAFAFTVGSNLVTFPKTVYTTDDKYTSGVRFAWTAEAPSSDISESTNPVSGRVDIPVHTSTASIVLTRANMEDAQFDLLGFVGQLLSEAFVLGENDAFVNGDGVAKPQGLAYHPNKTVAVGSAGMKVLSGAANTIAWGSSTTGIIGTEAALPPQYESNAKWYANKKTFSALAALNAGTANWPQWLGGDQFPNAANGYQARLLGYPIVKDQFIEDIGDGKYPIYFGDMTGYWIADRVGITVEVLREIKALRDEVVIYARKRVGGQLVHDWRVKVMKSDDA